MKNITSDQVWRAQTLALKSLETNLKCLENATKELQIKVKNDKLDAHYSQNEDCLTYSLKVWRSCLRLAELKKLEWDLEGRDNLGKLTKTENE